MRYRRNHQRGNTLSVLQHNGILGSRPGEGTGPRGATVRHGGPGFLARTRGCVCFVLAVSLNGTRSRGTLAPVTPVVPGAPGP